MGTGHRLHSARFDELSSDEAEWIAPDDAFLAYDLTGNLKEDLEPELSAVAFIATCPDAVIESVERKGAAIKHRVV